MQGLEAVIAQLTLFEQLRPDEIGRIAARFRVETLAAGATRVFEATEEGARLIVAVEGHVSIEVDSAAGTLRSRLEPGDRHGEGALLTRMPHAGRAPAMAAWGGSTPSSTSSQRPRCLWPRSSRASCAPGRTSRASSSSSTRRG